MQDRERASEELFQTLTSCIAPNGTSLHTDALHARTTLALDDSVPKICSAASEVDDANPV